MEKNITSMKIGWISFVVGLVSAVFTFALFLPMWKESIDNKIKNLPVK